MLVCALTNDNRCYHIFYFRDAFCMHMDMHLLYSSHAIYIDII